MNKSEYRIVGVMSGTSLDGIDLVSVTFYKEAHSWSFKIHAFETISYSKKWYSTLKNLVNKTYEDLQKIDVDYTLYLAEVINQFIEKYKLKDIDAICSHGHTALHQPEEGITYQIGNLLSIYQILQKTIVCDFRVQDVAYGGQGAPLVPIGDKLLFSDYDFCLNLGGFANISTDIEGKRIAFDICPVNIVLNHYISILGFDFDDKGKIASTGEIHLELLDTLNSIDYFKKSYPKSLGLEWVNNEIFPLINSFQLPIETILRTYVEHVAIQISNEINKKDNSNVLITGGGAYHTFLINRIKKKTNNQLVIPEKSLLEFKEAIVFGFLGVLKIRGDINCLSSVTGAKQDHSSGKIYIH